MTSGTKEPGTLPFGFTLSADPIRAAFQRRSLKLLQRIATEASIESLNEALTASTDVGTLAQALGNLEIIGSAITQLEPLAPLIARNAEHRLELLEAAGGTLTAEEVGTMLGITRQAVDKRRRTGSLLALRQGSDWRYPRCQFNEPQHEVVNDFPKFLKAFAGTGPWVLLDLLLAPDDTLGGRTPLDVLGTEGWTPSLERLARIEQGDGFA